MNEIFVGLLRHKSKTMLIKQVGTGAVTDGQHCGRGRAANSQTSNSRRCGLLCPFGANAFFFGSLHQKTTVQRDAEQGSIFWTIPCFNVAKISATFVGWVNILSIVFGAFLAIL